MNSTQSSFPVLLSFTWEAGGGVNVNTTSHFNCSEEKKTLIIILFNTYNTYLN